MQLEETQMALAELVIFLRSQPCPYHEHTTVGLFDAQGEMYTWHGPVCMITDNPFGVQCDWLDESMRLLDNATEALGTRDMSRFI